MDTHSKGPWSYEENYDVCCGRACTPRGCMEDHPSGTYSVDGPAMYECARYMKEADASLIAAAPDLLHTLKDVLSWISNWDPDFRDDPEWAETENNARTAIAKAEGKVTDA